MEERSKEPELGNVIRIDDERAYGSISTTSFVGASRRS